MSGKGDQPWQRRIRRIAEQVRAGCIARGVDVPVDLIVKDLTRKVSELAQAGDMHRGAALDQLPSLTDLVAGYLDVTSDDQLAALSGPRTLIPGDVTPGDVVALMCNPIYAIEIDEQLCVPHEPILDEDTWVAANVRAIEEIGAEPWLRNLLSVLKGNWIAGPDVQDDLGD